MLVSQSCAVESCPSRAAFRTRSKPGYCIEHVHAIFQRAGLDVVEPLIEPTTPILTRCRECGVQTHCRFVYIENWAADGSPACRACHWRSWAKVARATSEIAPRVVPLEEARAHAESHNYDYIRPLTEPSLTGDPHLTRCQNCRKIEAQRLADISFVCPCTKNNKRAAPGKTLLRDSGSSALEWWDYDNNTAALIATISAKARRDVRWKCPVCEHSFTEQVCRMDRPSCPKCRELARIAWEDWWASLRGLTAADIPELADAWDDDIYDADEVLITEGRGLRPSGFRLRCPEGHHPRLDLTTYLDGGCHICRGQKTRKQNEGTVRLPVEVASQYHPTRNTKSIEKITPGSNRAVWWVDTVCGHEWEASPAFRERQPRWRCPECRTRRDSLGWHHPELAAEWAPENPVTPFHVTPTGKLWFLPEWACSEDPAHKWKATLVSRVSGAGCPECKVAGKSKVELAYLAAARELFPKVASGPTVRHEQFTRRASWTVDILVERDVPIAVEYDGAYWHAGKEALDSEKSRDLLAAGYEVIRLREHPLVSLGIDHPAYTEVVVYATAPDPVGVLAAIAEAFNRNAVSSGLRHS